MLKRTYSIENTIEPLRRLRLNHYEVVRRMQQVKNARFGLARVQNLSTFYSCMHPPREIISIYFLFYSKKKHTVKCAFTLGSVLVVTLMHISTIHSINIASKTDSGSAARVVITVADAWVTLT